MEAIDAWQQALTKPVQDFLGQNIAMVAIFALVCIAGLFVASRNTVFSFWFGDGDSDAGGDSGGDGGGGDGGGGD